MTLDAATVRESARGRWESLILPALCVPVPNTPRKHGPCPTCGGKDRFRFDDRNGFGSWFCNQCDPKAGDGFALVMNIRRLKFRDALHLVAGVLGMEKTVGTRTHRPLRPPAIRMDRRAVAFRFELGALDLRIRAERIIDAGKIICVVKITDDELDHALALVGRGYADIERAELFECVADDLRLKEFLENDHA